MERENVDRGTSIAATFGIPDWTCVYTMNMTQEWDEKWWKENIRGRCRTIAMFNYFEFESDALLFTLRFT